MPSAGRQYWPVSIALHQHAVQHRKERRQRGRLEEATGGIIRNQEIEAQRERERERIVVQPYRERYVMIGRPPIVLKIVVTRPEQVCRFAWVYSNICTIRLHHYIVRTNTASSKHFLLSDFRIISNITNVNQNLYYILSIYFLTFECFDTILLTY